MELNNIESANNFTLISTRYLLYAILVLLFYRIYTLEINSHWLVNLNVYDQYLNLMKYNGTIEKPIMVTGTDTHVVGFLIDTTNPNIYQEPFFLLLIFMKIIGYGLILWVIVCLLKIVIDLEKKNTFTVLNIRRIKIINLIAVIYFLVVKPIENKATILLCQKIVFPNKTSWMIQVPDQSLNSYWAIMLLFMGIMSVLLLEGLKLKQENDLTV